MSRRAVRSALTGWLALVAAACADETPSRLPGGDAERGRAEVTRLQCGACHEIPGVRTARGNVGPSLAGFARRTYVAGKWPNEPSRLVAWLLDPPSLSPHTAMPALVSDERSARDIAAYLYTLE